MLKKEDILNEIRRTAAANGGLPLGRQRFFAETGIRETDWLGKYWARWNDAVREAGFEPNILQPAFDDDFLLEKLAGLVRSLGHFPTRPELKLHGRRDSSFPDANTFARFGRKGELAARLSQYCSSKSEYKDVAEISAAVPPPKEPRPAEAREPDFGFVYLLRVGKHYKIGCTNSVGRRTREIALQLPERATLVHSIRTDDPAGIEHYWHRRFQEKRGNGEWFTLTAEDIAAFRRRKFM